MLARFQKWLKPPTFEDGTLTNQAQSLNAILMTIFVLTILYLPYAIFFPPPGQVIIAIIALAMEIGLWVLMRSGRVRLASILLATMIWSAILVEEIIYGGVRDSGFASFAIVIVIASLTIGFTGGAFFTIITIIAGIGLITAENMNLLAPFAGGTNSSVLTSHSITFIAVLLLLYLATRSITISSRKIQEEEKATRAINRELEQSQLELQERSRLLEKRNRALETVTEIGHLFNRTRDEGDFLKQVVNLLTTRLDFECIHIYLLDQARENAILRASNKETSSRLLQITRSSISHGFESGDTLSYQIGNETYYITPPAIAEGMQSTVNLPIETGSKMLGLLNMQTSTPGSSAEDISVLDTVADQIANALENLRMFEQLEERLREIEQLAGEATQSGWKKLEAGVPLGYKYDRIQVLPGSEQYPPEVIKKLLERKSVTYVTSGVHRTSRLVAPIILRNQVLGMIGYEEDDPGHVWEQDNIIILETIASQVSLALENTRLIAEAQERAQQEKLIANITSRMRETLDIDIILQTAIREMREAFALKEAEIRLQSIENESREE
jgi:GAF domain-containing protein